MRSLRDRAAWVGDGPLSPGVLVVLGVAVVSGVAVALTGVPQRDGRELWLFARGHHAQYRPFIEDWNAAHAGTGDDIDAFLLSMPALERRMMSGFYSGTPVAELIEVEINVAGRVFAGPIEDVGLIDLRPRLAADGLLGDINPPSLTPWSRQGRIFGLPHDVHPVMLAYDAAAFEAAGIDVGAIETWDDYMAATRPLMTDEGAGRRYALNIWYTDPFGADVLMQQAGGGLFDAAREPDPPPPGQRAGRRPRRELVRRAGAVGDPGAGVQPDGEQAAARRAGARDAHARLAGRDLDAGPAGALGAGEADAAAGLGAGRGGGRACSAGRC